MPCSPYERGSSIGDGRHGQRAFHHRVAARHNLPGTLLPNLGRDLCADHLPHLNVNTQQGGIVYLRGPMHSLEESTRIEQIVCGIEGVTDVMNELHIQQEINN